MAFLAADQLNVARACSWTVIAYGCVLWLLGILVSTDQSLFSGELFYGSPSLSREIFLFTFVLELRLKLL